MIDRARACAKHGLRPGLKLRPAALFLLILGALPALTFSQNVLPGGGGATESQNHRAFATLGQGITGTTRNGELQIYCGFPFTLSSILSGSLPDTAHGFADSPGTIRISLSENATSATLHYRVGGQQRFYHVTMSTVGKSEKWEGSIPVDHMTIKGIQYYVSAGDGSPPDLVLPGGAPDAALANMEIAVEDFKIFTLPAKSYRSLGLPLEMADAAHNVVFDEFGAYDKKQWRYCTYDPDEPNKYLEPGAPAVPGQGFWIITRYPKFINVSGNSIPLDKNFVLPLDNGWNQIANPFAFAISQDRITRSENVGTDPFHSYDSLQSDNHYPDVGLTNSLEAYKGYWIHNDGPDGETLTFDIIGGGSKDGSKSGPPSLVPDDDEIGWSVGVKVSAGDFGDQNNHFGLRAEATSDKDPFDFWEPPLPPGGYAGLTFLTPEDDWLITDYRDPNSTGERWRLQMSSDQVDVRFQIRFIPDRDLPSNWRVLVIDPATLLEYDVLAGDLVTGRVGSKDFTRTWQILAGEDDYVTSERQAIQEEYNRGITNFSLAPAFPNPFEATTGTTISMTTPRTTARTLRIYDLRGRVVKTLQAGWVDQGLTRINWYGDDDSGHRAAAGVYFVRMQAAGHDFIKKVVLLR
ncbi:MAG: FlgD immunoglobulin-like domain containing protein [bacterium]